MPVMPGLDVGEVEDLLGPDPHGGEGRKSNTACRRIHGALCLAPLSRQQMRNSASGE
jgi:hypothetical protein